MQRKAGNRRREPIRYVVEHVYSGKESMEKVLTAVSEEAAKQNVKEKLEIRKRWDEKRCRFHRKNKISSCRRWQESL